MLSAAKAAALKDFLRQLPESAVGRLAAAVEADRLAGNTGLPHEVILDALRPKLAVVELPPVAAPERDPLDDLDAYAQTIRASRPADFDEHALIENLGVFAVLSGVLMREIGINPDDRRAQRLAKYRSSVADIMDGFMERAPRAILAALPVHKLGSFGLRNPRRLDLARAPDQEKVARAKRFAYLLVHAKPFALPLAFDGTFAPALEETVTALRRYGEDIAREVRVSIPETRAMSEAHLQVALELSAIVLGKQEADLIRRQSLSS